MSASHVSGRFSREIVMMQDILWIAVTIVFFGISIGYVHFCDRVK